ncbi:MAG: hypothetical protein HC905_17600 [Bacteroidales bacterium]|nr:hypothetical protein [Bacteroidales bacterium]
MKDLFSLQNPEEINEKMSSFLIIYNALATISSSFVAVILHVAILFQYFNIVELYEGHTLSHKIDQLTRDEATRTE